MTSTGHEELIARPGATELARHALGLVDGRKASYRNRFVCGPDHSDFAEWERMVSIGDAERHDMRHIFGGDYLFMLTIKGAQAVLRPGETLDPEDFPFA